MKYRALKNFRISSEETKAGQEYSGKGVDELLRLGLIEIVAEVSSPEPSAEVIPEALPLITEPAQEPIAETKKKKKKG